MNLRGPTAMPIQILQDTPPLCSPVLPTVKNQNKFEENTEDI